MEKQEKILTPREAFAHFMEHILRQLVEKREGNPLYGRAKRLERALAGKAADWKADDESIEKFLNDVAPDYYEFRHHIQVVVKEAP
jgi:hypothetical protein